MIDPITGLPSSNIQNKDGTISYASPIIDATKVGTTPVITVPPPVTVPDTTYTSAINSVGASAQASQDAIQAEQEAQAKLAQSQGVSSDISKLESQLGGKAADTANLYSTAGGVNDAYKQLKDLNAQAIGLKNEASAIPIQTPLAYQGTAATQQTIASVNRDKLSQNALKALSLGQQAAIAQGNFDVAKSLADQQIEVKYSQMEADLKSKQTQLAALDKYVLTPAQEKAKSALERQYKLQDQEIADKKAQEKEMSSMFVNASSQGAPSSLVTKAQQAKNPMEAAKILGEYAGDFYKTSLLKAQIETERAQKAKYYADINKIKSEMNTKGLPTTTANIAKVEASQAVYDIAQELLTAQGKGGAVGFGFKKSVIGSLPFAEGTAIAGTDRATYEAKFKQLKDTLASANLDKLKGAMSDKDIEFLRNIGTALSLDMPEKSFDAELKKVQNTMSKIPGVQVQKVEQTQNKFNQALGIPSGSVPGSSIIKNVDDSGSINFIIP